MTTVVRPENPIFDAFFRQIPEVIQSAVINDHIVLYRTLDTPANNHEIEIRILIHEPDIVSEWPEQFVGQMDAALNRWIDALTNETCDIDGHVSEINVAARNPTMLQTRITINTQPGGVFVVKPSEFFDGMLALVMNITAHPS